MDSPSAPDADLGESVRQPDRVAALYVTYGERVRAFLWGVLRDHDLVAEALQNTFSKALTTGGPDVTDAQWSWLSRVALNEAHQLRRKQAIQERSIRKLSASQIGDVAAGSPPDALVTAETAAQVRAAVELLPAEQRRVVELRTHEDLTFAEIAAREGVALGTVLTRMRLALEKLRTALK